MININSLKEYNKPIKIVGHSKADFDSMTSGYLLEYILNQLNVSAQFIVPDGFVCEFFQEAAEKIGFEYEINAEFKKDDILFLVDHTGTYLQEVVGCFDHHPEIVKIESNYINKPKTSCARLIYEWAEEIGIKIPEKLTILTIYACYMDSLSFKSTKALPEDEEWCLEQMKRIGLDEKEVETFGFGLTRRNKGTSEYYLTGVKTYAIDGGYIKSSYAVVDKDDEDMEEARRFFEKELTETIVAWCYVISNVKRDITKILLVTKEFSLIRIVPALLSRGKDIIPTVMRFLSFKNDGALTKILIEKGLTVSTMESCTSGLIASNVTDYEGASTILKGSSIAYSNEAKIMEGVSASIVEQYGIYSPETAIEMAWNSILKYHSNIGIGVTGSFGNVDPSNKDSIAGVVYYHIMTENFQEENAINNRQVAVKLIYHNLELSRKEMKQKTVDVVLATLSTMI